MTATVRRVSRLPLVALLLALLLTVLLHHHLLWLGINGAVLLSAGFTVITFVSWRRSRGA